MTLSEWQENTTQAIWSKLLYVGPWVRGVTVGFSVCGYVFSFAGSQDGGQTTVSWLLNMEEVYSCVKYRADKKLAGARATACNLQPTWLHKFYIGRNKNTHACKKNKNAKTQVYIFVCIYARTDTETLMYKSTTCTQASFRPMHILHCHCKHKYTCRQEYICSRSYIMYSALNSKIY